MNLSRRSMMSGLGAAALLPALPRRARAQDTNVIRIGVLNDQAGPTSANNGPGSVACAQQAIDEFQANGFKVELLFADHQNKPDLGTTIARKWFDQDGVDAIVDVPPSSVALAVNQIAREKNKVHLNVGAATTELTGAQCTPVTVSWVYDTYMLAKSNGGAVTRAGGKSWFFITADYAFGHSLERDAMRFVKENGGEVVGSVRFPFPSSDFSSYLLKAQASGAKIVGLATAGQDTITCIKQAAEFGIVQGGQKLAGLLMLVQDVHSLGLETAQGLLMTESFYWDLNDRTRAVTKRLLPRLRGFYPHMGNIGSYSAVLHYLKTVQDMGPKAAKASGVDVVNRMKAMPTDDDAFGPGSIRQDGRKLCPVHLFEVKKPSESKYPWDYLKLVSTTPGEDGFRPLAEGGCPLVKT